MTATTPLRSATPPLAPEQSPALGRLETRLLAAITAAADPSSMSDDLELTARGWVEQYHLSPQRANVLRSLPLPVEPTVLEIGARGGGLTRYLGELGGPVDALETDPAMAAVARARCADLPLVTIHETKLADLPREPGYDLVVVVDALDEQGLGIDGLLELCGAVLNPDGLIVLAADNVDGVRFVAGDTAPPIGRAAAAPPRRLLQADVETAVAAAGYATRSLHAFPDHRHTKVLYDHDALVAIDPALLAELPSFPSPPYRVRSTTFPEEQLWRAAIHDGTAAGHANSFVVLAGREVPALEPAATYWSLGRRSAQSAANRVVRHGHDVVVERAPAFPSMFPADGPLRLRPHTEPFVRGTSMVEALAEATTLEDAARLLTAWRDLVTAACEGAQSVPWDLIPRNVVVTDDGQVRTIDQEWELDGGDAVTVLSRGCFWLAHDLLIARTPPGWLPPSTVASGARLIAQLARCGLQSDWLDRFIDRESVHMSCVWPANARYSRSGRARKEWHKLTELSNLGGETAPLEDSPTDAGATEPLQDVVAALSATNAELQQRVQKLEMELRHAALVHRDHAIGLMATAETFRRRHEIAEESLAQARAKAARLTKRVRAMRASRTWRVGSFFTRPMARLKGR